MHFHRPNRSFGQLHFHQSLSPAHAEGRARRGVHHGQGIAAGVAGHQLGIRRQANAEAIEGLAITADREGGLGLDAAAVELGRDIAKGLQGRRLAGRSVRRMPAQFEIAVQADDGQFRFLVATAGRLQRRAFGNPGHGLGIGHLELQFGGRRPWGQQPQPRFLAHHGQGHEHFERELVLLAGRSANPGDIALAIALEIQEVFAGALVLGRFAKHGLVQPQWNPRPLVFADQDPELDGQFGLSGRD